MSNYSWMSERLKRKSLFISQYELAWKITDADDFIEDAILNQVIVLGGDILDANLQYTLDNWYYEPDKSISRKVNSLQSCNCMKKYIERYIERNGSDFYAIIICQQRKLLAFKTMKPFRRSLQFSLH